MNSPTRVLVVHRSIIWRQDEASDVWEQITGLMEASTSVSVDVRITDGSYVYRPKLSERGMHLERVGSLAAMWLRGADVVHVHVAVPISHLIIATLFRLRGSKIVFSPMTFLSDEFALRPWVRRRPRQWTRVKPFAVRFLGLAWNVVTHMFVCVSRREVLSSHLPESKCALLPWPKPHTPLLQGHPRLDRLELDRRQLPIAFVSRMDVWRKGIDQLGTWLSEYFSALPRPAVVLLAPRHERTPPQIHELSRMGLIEWDWQSRGAALLGPLQRCRGVMLLSRFDGQPRSLREAVCLGLPTLCTPASHFDEVVSALGFGKVVSGKDTAEIQAAFESLGEQEGSAERALRLFDRVEIGRFLLSLYMDLAGGRSPTRRNYYDQFIGVTHQRESV